MTEFFHQFNYDKDCNDQEYQGVQKIFLNIEDLAKEIKKLRERE